MRRRQKTLLVILAFIVGVIGLVVGYTGGSIMLTTRDDMPDVDWGADVRGASTAGSLALDRDAFALYDPDGIAIREANASRFIYPPWYAVLMIPFSLIPFPAAFFVWSAVGAGLLLASIWLLEIRPPALVFLIVLATWAAFQTVWYGQSSFVLLAILGLGLRLWLAGRNVSAGVAIALCAFKPHLLLGFVVLWLADPRRWRTLVVSAVGATVVLAAASELWIPGAWAQFIGNIFDTGVLLVPEREVSLLAAFQLLLPNAGSWVWPIWGIVIAAIVGSFLATVRSWQGHAAVPVALAIVVSLLLSLHGLSYDLLVLVAAFALLSRYGGFPSSTRRCHFCCSGRCSRSGFWRQMRCLTDWVGQFTRHLSFCSPYTYGS